MERPAAQQAQREAAAVALSSPAPAAPPHREQPALLLCGRGAVLRLRLRTAAAASSLHRRRGGPTPQPQHAEGGPPEAEAAKAQEHGRPRRELRTEQQRAQLAHRAAAEHEREGSRAQRHWHASRKQREDGGQAEALGHPQHDAAREDRAKSEASGGRRQQRRQRPHAHGEEQQLERRQERGNPASGQLREDVAVGKRGQDEPALHHAPAEFLRHRDHSDRHDVAIRLVDGIRCRCQQDVVDQAPAHEGACQASSGRLKLQRRLARRHQWGRERRGAGASRLQTSPRRRIHTQFSSSNVKGYYLLT